MKLAKCGGGGHSRALSKCNFYILAVYANSKSRRKRLLFIWGGREGAARLLIWGG
jgi:hypothetical protein